MEVFGPIFLLSIAAIFACQNYSSQNLSPTRITESISSEKPDAEIKKTMNHSDNFNYLTIQETPYYLQGPQQGRPEDGIFKVGIKLKLIENSGSYVRVETEQGLRAYVAISAIDKI